MLANSLKVWHFFLMILQFIFFLVTFFFYFFIYFFYFILFILFGSLTPSVPGPVFFFLIPFSGVWIFSRPSSLQLLPVSSLHWHHDIASPRIRFRAFPRSPNGNVLRISVLVGPRWWHAYSGNLDVSSNYRNCLMVRGNYSSTRLAVVRTLWHNVQSNLRFGTLVLCPEIYDQEKRCYFTSCSLFEVSDKNGWQNNSHHCNKNN